MAVLLCGVRTCSRVQIHGAVHKMIVGHTQCSFSRVSRILVHAYMSPGGHVSIEVSPVGVVRGGIPAR